MFKLIVDRFVATQSAGDTTCASQYNEVRMVEAFPQSLADAAPAPQGATVKSSVGDRRLADVVSNTVADVLPRWFSNYDGTGVGQQIGHLRCGKPEVDGHECRAQLRGGEHRLEECHAVDHQGGYAVAFANPHRT